jgi:hypothetical protein
MGDQRWNGRFKGSPPKVEPVPMVRVTHVIGEGTPADPVREVQDYYHQDGTHMWRVDPTEGAADGR